MSPSQHQISTNMHVAHCLELKSHISLVSQEQELARLAAEQAQAAASSRPKKPKKKKKKGKSTAAQSDEL